MDKAKIVAELVKARDFIGRLSLHGLSAEQVEEITRESMRLQNLVKSVAGVDRSASIGDALEAVGLSVDSDLSPHIATPVEAVAVGDCVVLWLWEGHATGPTYCRVAGVESCQSFITLHTIQPNGEELPIIVRRGDTIKTI